METERRRSSRLVLTSPVLVSLGESKVGILFDLGEGGLSVCGLIPRSEIDFRFITFLLPGAKNFIQARSEIAWSDAATNRTGLRFVRLGERAQRDLREFVILKSRDDAAPAHFETAARQDKLGFATEAARPVTKTYSFRSLWAPRLQCCCLSFKRHGLLQS